MYDNSCVFGNAQISGDVRVSGSAHVFGKARVNGNAIISGNARLSGEAHIEKTDDYLVIGPIGSGDGYTTFAVNTDGEIIVSCGCFNGSIQEFENKVHEVHSGTRHEQDYMLAIEFAKRKMKYRSL